VKALVTGAAGFLARYIVEQLLARGDVVRGFARGPCPQLEALGVEVVRGDIRDPQAVSAACSQVDVVFQAKHWASSECWRLTDRAGFSHALYVRISSGVRAISI
jgi:uncharacterized protein YbjT (DUF2867 family)